MKKSSVAKMGKNVESGDNRENEAVTGALASPLLKDNEIEGARYILLNITSGTKEVTMDEVSIITDYIQEKAGLTADLIWGNCIDDSLEEELSVTIIATGFQTSEERVKERENEKIAIPLTPEPATPYIKPVVQNQFVERPAQQSEFFTPVQTPVTSAVTSKAVPQVDLFSPSNRYIDSSINVAQT